MKNVVSHVNILLSLANKKDYQGMDANLESLKSRRKLTFEEEYIHYLVAVIIYMDATKTIMPKEEIETENMYEAIYHNRFGLAYDIIQKKSQVEKLSQEEIIALLLLKEISTLKRDIQKDQKEVQKVKAM